MNGFAVTAEIYVRDMDEFEAVIDRLKKMDNAYAGVRIIVGSKEGR